MQRRAFLMRASAGVAATAIARPAIAQTGAPVRWRLATSWPKSLDTLYGGVEAMCQRVGQITDRKFQIQCFAGGEIVPPLQVWDATQNGTVECGHTLTSFNIGKNPAVAFDSGLAFGLNTRQQQAWMNYGGGLELIRALFKKDGILPIPCGNVGVQMGGFYRKEINSVDDLKGLKFRIGGLGGMILAKLGVVPCRFPRPTFILPSNAARSMPPSGSVLTTTRSSGCTRSPNTTTTLAGGKAALRSHCSSISSIGRLCRSPIEPRWRRRAPRRPS